MKSLSGSITARENKEKRRCRKWQLRVSMGKDPMTGKYEYKTKRFTGSYKEAQEELEAFISELESGYRGDGGITVAEYLDDWENERKMSGELSERTLQGEYYDVKNINRHLGQIPLSELTARHINRMYAGLRSGNSASGKKLSGTSCVHIHKTLMNMLRQADLEELVDPKLLRTIKAPKSDTRPKQALTKEQVSNLLAQLDYENPMHTMIALCVMCGLRRSEALALTWEDIEGDVIYINKDLNEDGTVKMCPKSSAGYRYVPIPQTVADGLTIRHAFQCLLLGDEATSKTPVIDNIGEYYKPHSASHWWRLHRSEFGLSCTLHELRHTYTTMLISGNVDVKTVQTLLGHASPDVTLEVYAHVHDEQKIAAVKTLNDMVG